MERGYPVKLDYLKMTENKIVLISIFTMIVYFISLRRYMYDIHFFDDNPNFNVYIIKNKITSPDKLYDFNEAGYAFNSNLSSDFEFVFVR